MNLKTHLISSLIFCFLSTSAFSSPSRSQTQTVTVKKQPKTQAKKVSKILKKYKIHISIALTTAVAAYVLYRYFGSQETNSSTPPLSESGDSASESGDYASESGDYDSESDDSASESDDSASESGDYDSESGAPLSVTEVQQAKLYLDLINNLPEIPSSNERLQELQNTLQRTMKLANVLSAAIQTRADERVDLLSALHDCYLSIVSQHTKLVRLNATHQTLQDSGVTLTES